MLSIETVEIVPADDKRFAHISKTKKILEKVERENQPITVRILMTQLPMDIHLKNIEIYQ